VQDIYTLAGYPCVVTSAVTGFGLERVASFLKGKVTILAGQSGAGKSKLLSSLIGADLLTGELSSGVRAATLPDGYNCFGYPATATSRIRPVFKD